MVMSHIIKEIIDYRFAACQSSVGVSQLSEKGHSSNDRRYLTGKV